METYRAGYLLARNEKAYRAWSRQSGSTREKGLSGAALEQAVMGLALTYPNLVRFKGA